MSEHMFLAHRGHLKPAAVGKIEKRHFVTHTNYTDANGDRRGWFSCPNHGSPFNERAAAAVLADIEAAGGFEALRYARDR
jgi:hypothetical protein